MITNIDMTKMTNKPITSDLFQVDTCDDCKGEGFITTELTFSNDSFGKNVPCGERQDDCDTCNGTGIIQ